MKYVKKAKRNVMTKNMEGKMYQIIWILIVAAINISISIFFPTCGVLPLIFS
jgi:hypothetical protein